MPSHSSASPPLFTRARLKEPRAAMLALLIAATPAALSTACDRTSGHGSASAPNSGSPQGSPPASAAASASDAASASASVAPVTLSPVPPLFPSGKHPYADMGRALGTVVSVPVRGRIVEEKGQPDNRASTPTREFSQDEIGNAEFEAVLLKSDGSELLTLGKGKCDSEGYIDARFPLTEGAAAPGRYYVDIRVKSAFAGRTTVHLLPAKYAGTVIQSDIDLTYLDTHFTRKRDVLNLLTQKASEKIALPAMEKVYRALRVGASGAEDVPLVFISGSPRFFKRVLEARMEIDGIQQDGVLLKAFDEIATDKVTSLEIDHIVPALKEQVGYKLRRFLNSRLELPPNTQEILMGDDSEADFVTYSIYHRILNGDLDQEATKKELARAGVDPGIQGQLAELGAKVRATLSGSSPVKAIYINLTGTPNAKLKVVDWPVAGLMRAHRGTWPLILDLYEDGLVSRQSVTAVKERLIELGQSLKDLEEGAKAGVTSGFLKPESVGLN